MRPPHKSLPIPVLLLALLSAGLTILCLLWYLTLRFAPMTFWTLEAPRYVSGPAAAEIVRVLRMRAQEVTSRPAEVEQISPHSFRVGIRGVDPTSRDAVKERLERAGKVAGVLELPPPSGGTVVVLTNASVRDAFLAREKDNGAYYVAVKLTKDASDQFAEVTTQNRGQFLSISLDGVGLMRAQIADPITTGHMQIGHAWHDEAGKREAGDLAFALRTPPLPFPLKGALRSAP